MATRRRKWIVAGACVLAATVGLLGTAYFGFIWMVDRSGYALHAPGTYYFVSFTGSWVPWRPVNEISRDEALSRDSYVVGVYADDGRLAVIERYWGGSLFFRHEYSYDAEGKLREERSWQEGGPVQTRQFGGSSE